MTFWLGGRVEGQPTIKHKHQSWRSSSRTPPANQKVIMVHMLLELPGYLFEPRGSFWLVRPQCYLHCDTIHHIYDLFNELTCRQLVPGTQCVHDETGLNIHRTKIKLSDRPSFHGCHTRCVERTAA